MPDEPPDVPFRSTMPDPEPPDFSDISFRGSGRDNPEPRQPTKRGTDDLGGLNIVAGTRIRVIEDNGRRRLTGLEGMVVQAGPGYVVVELENDPMLFFRAHMQSGFATPKVPPKRHFRVTEVERI